MTTIYIPTINDELSDFDKLFTLWNQANDDNLNITFDFSHCYFLRQNAVAFLGGLARLIKDRSGAVSFNWDSMREDIRSNLGKSGFLNSFDHRGSFWTGNTIPYRENLTFDTTIVVDYLKSYWLGRGWINVSSLLKDAIVMNVLETYINAFEHGESPIGIFSCGQYYPNLHELKLTVVDFGVGIPSNVRYFFKDVPRFQSLSAASCLRWAFQRGTTTKPNGTSRGMGLDLLKNFVKINKGRLEIFSHEGYALISETQETFMNRDSFFEGTLVNITLQCDESYYRLSSEVVDEPIF
ncbi:MAG: ATP-binding protein [Nitrospirae bacterium]|nr:ATP-binding protein [Nitrospirota bacterium]